MTWSRRRSTAHTIAYVMAERHPFNLPGDKPHYAPDRYWRAEHLRLDISVDPAAKRVEGSATYTLRRASTLGEPADVVLDAEDMEVLDVSPARSWRHSEGKLTVEPEASGEELTLAIRYAAEPTKGMY